MRVNELVGIDINDLNLDENAVTVIRKGGDQDTVYYNDDVKQALIDYIEQRKQIISKNSNSSNALFLSNKPLVLLSS
jgi:integrase/recombinase XerC